MKITLSNGPNQTFSPTTQALNAIISLAAALVLASCASPPRTAIHTPVAPQVASEEHDGFLKVDSASAWTSDHDDGGSVIYTDYQIHSPAGTLFREVINGSDTPRRVVLPKGNYTVVADSDNSGVVRIPIAISSGKLTELHLEREKDWNPSVAKTGSAELVRLPNDQPIGYRAAADER